MAPEVGLGLTADVALLVRKQRLAGREGSLSHPKWKSG
jgi:hypothetical protein